MKPFEVIAHRGAMSEAPENTLEAFLLAIEIGADAIEFDVRLTADKIPIIYHYFYLDEITSLSGPIFEYDYNQLKNIEFINNQIKTSCEYSIPTLEMLLESIGGKIGLELEIKGPEPESAEIIGKILRNFEYLYDNLEVTSYEPYLLKQFQKVCPEVKVDLLVPLSEKWMKSDVLIYSAIQHARIAGAKTIHLHPTQLSQKVIKNVQKKGLDIHTWDINDIVRLKKVLDLNINRICTDRCRLILNYRNKLF